MGGRGWKKEREFLLLGAYPVEVKMATIKGEGTSFGKFWEKIE